MGGQSDAVWINLSEGLEAVVGWAETELAETKSIKDGAFVAK